MRDIIEQEREGSCGDLRQSRRATRKVAEKNRSKDQEAENPIPSTESPTHRVGSGIAP